MATKKDIDILWNEVKSRAPRWVMILLAGLMSAIVGWMFISMEGKFQQFYVVRANQEILLKAFNIQPVANVKQAEKELKKEGGE